MAIPKQDTTSGGRHLVPDTVDDCAGPKGFSAIRVFDLEHPVKNSDANVTAVAPNLRRIPEIS